MQTQLSKLPSGSYRSERLTIDPKVPGRHCMFLWDLGASCLRNVLAVEDTEGFLQRLDLFLPAGNTVLVAHTCIYTRRLQLLIVRKRCIELFLCAIKIRLLLLKRLLLVLLLPGLVLDVLCLLSLIN